jgi:amino acid transporter
MALSSRPFRGRKLTLLPLVMATYFMVSGGPYGIEDILGGAGFAGGLLILILLPLVWSLPTALMIGELASAIPADGGFYVWVRRALGPFWGFQEAWLSLTASIFDMAIYPALFVLYLGKLAPAWTAGHRSTLWILAIIGACALWNLLGARPVGDGATWMFALLLAPFAVLCGYAVMHGIDHGTALPAAEHCGGAGMGTAILVALWNYMGWDNASTVAQEVERPQQNYPRAMIWAIVLVTATYAIPLAAIWIAGVNCADFQTGAWADAATHLAGRWLGVAIVASGTLSAVGMFNVLMLSYTRLPYAMAEDGMLPQVLARRNRRDVPWVAVLACAMGWAFAAQMSFERLLSLDIILYGGSLILEFAALVVLRLREPELERPFRAGNLAFAVILGMVPAGLIVFAGYLSHGERMAGMPALVFAGLLAGGGPVAYLANRWGRKWAARPGVLPAAQDG